MAKVYRNAGPWGAGSGSGAGGLLTSLEVDENFYDSEQRLAALEAALSAGMVFDDPPATVSPGVVTFHLTDGVTTTDIDVPLPVASFNPRGAWAASTPYAYLDIVTVAGLGAYLVMENHTSDTTFDPDAGESTPYYQLLFSMPATEAPEALNVSGATRTLSLDDAGLYLRCTNAAGCVVTVPTNASVAIAINTEIHFRQAGDGPVSFVPATGSVTINPQRDGDATTTYKGQVLTLKKISSNQWDLYGADGPSTIPLTESGTTRTLALTDQDKYIRCTNAAGCAVTVPPEASIDFEAGAEVHLRQCDAAGTVSIVAGSGVTINVRTGRLEQTAALGAVVTLKKVGTDEWDLFGDLASDTSSGSA